MAQVVTEMGSQNAIWALLGGRRCVGHCDADNNKLPGISKANDAIMFGTIFFQTTSVQGTHTRMPSNVVIAQQRCGSGSQLLFGEGASNSTTTSSWVSPGCVVEAASDNITRTTYIMPRLVCCEGANENPTGTKHEPIPIDCAKAISRAETNADHDLLPARHLGNHKLRPLHQSHRYRISDLFLA